MTYATIVPYPLEIYHRTIPLYRLGLSSDLQHVNKCLGEHPVVF
jgi:hypothetical protein